MSIEINRTRVLPDGRVTCEVVFPNLGSYSRGTADLLRIEPRGFDTPTGRPPDAAAMYALRRQAAERLPRANLPPFTDFAERPFPGGFMVSGDEE